MELIRTAELALRSSKSPSSSSFTSCLYRSKHRHSASSTFIRCRQSQKPISQTACRRISTSSPISQQAGTAKKEEDHINDIAQSQPPSNDPAQRRQQQSSQGAPSQPRTSSADYRDLIEGRLDFVPRGSDRPKPDNTMARDTIAMMRSGLLANRERKSAPSSRSPLDLGNMLTPSYSSDPSRPFAPVRSQKPIEVATQAPPFEVGPRLGRTVDVDETKNVDLARAFRLPDMKCAVNRVRQDFNAQRFHERPGLKRKRLKSQRWRRRFKADFQRTVQRVKSLHRQGW